MRYIASSHRSIWYISFDCLKETLGMQFPVRADDDGQDMDHVGLLQILFDGNLYDKFVPVSEALNDTVGFLSANTVGFQQILLPSYSRIASNFCKSTSSDCDT